MTWPFGWVKSEHEDLGFHFPSLTTSFKILHWDSQPDQTKKNKEWGRRNLLDKKFIKIKEGEEVHMVALENWEEAVAWSICNDKWRNFSKIHKSLSMSKPTYFISKKRGTHLLLYVFIFFFSSFTLLISFSIPLIFFQRSCYPIGKLCPVL